MARFFINVIFIILLLTNCHRNKNPEGTKVITNQKYCYYGVCFKNPIRLIDSTLNQVNYDGLEMKVYEINLEENETLLLDSLLKKGYQKLPFKREDLNEIPVLLEKYISKNDIGYYLLQHKNYDGDKFLILNISRKKFISYEYGILYDLIKKDSIKEINQK